MNFLSSDDDLDFIYLTRQELRTFDWFIAIEKGQSIKGSYFGLASSIIVGDQCLSYTEVFNNFLIKRVIIATITIQKRHHKTSYVPLPLNKTTI